MTHAAAGGASDGGPLCLLAATQDYSDLLDAVDSGSLRRVADLISAGVPVDPPRCSGGGVQDPRGTALHAAARGGHSVLVRLLLRRGADKVSLEPCGARPIHVAALNGHTRCVAVLLAHGVSVDQLDRDGRTPLQEAVQGGYLDTARLLVAAGANPNAEDRQGRSALAKVYDKLDGQHPAAAPMRALLLAAGATDAKNSSRDGKRTVLCMTPLQAAVDAGDRVEASRLLRAHPQSVHVEHFRAGTPLHMAARQGDADMAGLLLAAGAKPNARTSRGRELGSNETPLLCAIDAADPATVRALLAALPEPKAEHLTAPALHRAARHPDGDAVLELLLAAGADPRDQENDETARDVAATAAMRERLRGIMVAGNPAPCRRPLANAAALAKLIAAEGPRSARLPPGGRLPLHAAADARATDVIELLLNAGAELSDYDTPVGWSASEVTPLRRPRLPAWGGQELRDYVEGVSDGMVDLDWRQVTDEQAEAWCNSHPNDADNHYPGALTPLHMAAAFDMPRTVAALVRHGARLEKKTHLGDTPLMFAARRAGAVTVRALLEAGADLRVVGRSQCPLHEACVAGNAAAAGALIDAGADVNAPANWWAR